MLYKGVSLLFIGYVIDGKRRRSLESDVMFIAVNVKKNTKLGLHKTRFDLPHKTQSSFSLQHLLILLYLPHFNSNKNKF